MKSCPVCKSTYEDWIDFCFNDGIPLVAVQTPAPAATPAAASVDDEDEPGDRYSSFDAFDAPEPTMIRLARESHGGTNPGVEAPAAPAPVAVEPPAPPAPPPAVVEDTLVEVPVPPPVAPVARTFSPPPDPPPPAPVGPRTIVPDSPPPAPVLPPTPPVAVMEELPPPVAPPPPRSALDDEEEPAVSAVAKGAGAGLIIAGVLGVGFLIAVLAGGAWWFSTRGETTKPTANVEQPKPVEAPPKPVEPTPTAEVAPPVVEPPPPLPPEEVKPEEVKPPDAKVEPPKPDPLKPEPPKPEVKPVVPPVTPTTPTGTDAVWATPAAATKGVLIVTSDPVGAQVYVDGAARGSAPVRLELPYGAHTVRATLNGYTAQTREINLNVEQMSVPLKLASEISSGSINLFGPTGGHVWLDNHDLGTLPVTVVVAEGVRNIRLTQADGKTCSFAKEVRFTTPGKPVTVRLDGCP